MDGLAAKTSANVLRTVTTVNGFVTKDESTRATLLSQYLYPLLQELESNVGATIDHLSEHQSLAHSTHYKEYVQTNHQ